MQALWMLAAAFFFATMAVCVKFASVYFNSAELVFYRGLLGMFFMWALARTRGVALATRYPGMHMWRSLVGVISLGAWFYAIAQLPLATAMTLNYMSSVWIATFLVGGALLMGLLPARTGSIRFGEADLTAAKPYERVRAGIGYVPQGREIFPRLTVEENLKMGLATRPRRAEVPPRIFEMFPVLGQMLRRRGGDLSGGQQQQLAIGRALAMGPRLLILDEPTEGIQPSIIKDIERAIRSLAAGIDPQAGQHASTSSALATWPKNWSMLLSVVSCSTWVKVAVQSLVNTT